jgi:hypothetical protein
LLSARSKGDSGACVFVCVWVNGDVHPKNISNRQVHDGDARYVLATLRARAAATKAHKQLVITKSSVKIY